MKNTKLPTLTIYKISRGKIDDPILAGPHVTWGWRLVGANGEKLARHSQGGGFKSARSAWRNAQLVAVMLGGSALRNIKTPCKGSDFFVWRHVDNLAFYTDEDRECLRQSTLNNMARVLRVRRAG